MGNPFLNLLNDISNPDDKAKLTSLSPDTQKFLSDAALRQSDYSRIRDEHVRLKDAAGKWEPWQAGQRPEWERRFNEYPTLAAKTAELEQRYATAQAEINTLKAATPNGDGVIDASRLSQATKDLLNTELKPRLDGMVTREELKAQLAEAIKTATETSWNRAAENLMPAAMSAMELSNRYQREFGEPMGHEAFLKAASDSGRKGQESLDYAWQALAGPKMEAKRQAEFDSKLKEAREQGKLEGAREAQTHGNLPPGMEEAPHGFPFNSKPVDSIDKLPGDYELGQKGGFQLAAIAADELRKMSAARAQGQ